MSAQNGHITSKVILGYLLLILIAVCSVVYIYNIIEQFAGEDDPNNKSSEKVYLVTNTLSLLYESEALGQMVGLPQGEIKHFNRTLNKALQNMDSLRTLVSNPALSQDRHDRYADRAEALEHAPPVGNLARDERGTSVHPKHREGDRPARYDDPAGRNTGARDRAPGFRENSPAP